MPNLKQLQSLKEKYSNSNSNSLRKHDIEILLESFDPNMIQKSFDARAFSFPDFKVNDYIQYFLQRRKAQVVLLYIDIFSFSVKFSNKSGEELVEYLDGYYKKVLPIIDMHGGIVEKIIGDGIICVFGEPFLDDDVETLHLLAETCSRKVILATKNTIYESKVAFHFGEIMYYQNPSNEYFEYTMIGNALTELSRLESVSISNSVNFFEGTFFDNQISQQVIHYDSNTTPYERITNPPQWIYKEGIAVNFPGVKFNRMRRIEKN